MKKCEQLELLKIVVRRLGDAYLRHPGMPFQPELLRSELEGVALLMEMACHDVLLPRDLESYFDTIGLCSSCRDWTAVCSCGAAE